MTDDIKARLSVRLRLLSDAPGLNADERATLIEAANLGADLAAKDEQVRSYRFRLEAVSQLCNRREADLAVAVEALEKIKRGDFDESAPRQDMLPSEIAAAALARIKPTVESRNDTKHLLSSPANAKRLRAGVRELKAKPTDDYCGINQEPDEEVKR